LVFVARRVSPEVGEDVHFLRRQPFPSSDQVRERLGRPA
jgi:hypothetical protein